LDKVIKQILKELGRALPIRELGVNLSNPKQFELMRVA
jgi:hypothetical protein